MQRDEAIRILRKAEPELRARGVLSLALFGSTVRGEANSESDVDVMVEFDMHRHPSLVDFCGMRLLMESQLGCPTDLAIRENLRPSYRTTAEADAIRIF
ncbi:MAG TPA: nucleotidyltransferase domain-containing protein [Rhizomicrobium sp.]|jgi:predicted nucleotidyltransferase|nr:nucleotidyltransferase domain-containing protein [Rhizomicrobium sp.]